MPLPVNHNKPWTTGMLQRVHQLWSAGFRIDEIAHGMGRTSGAIWAKLSELYGYPYDAYGIDTLQEAIEGGLHTEPQPEEDTPKGSSMERNIAAMMHDDARTVKVKFQHKMAVNGTTLRDPTPPKAYTYVTIQPLAPGDLVAVYAGGAIQVAEVVEMDAVLDIEPNDNKEYEWIVQKLDTRPYELQVAKNEQLKTLIKENYKKTARSQMREMILTSLPNEAQAEALKLISPEK